MTLKLATLNILHNRLRWEERIGLIADALRAEQPDVIALQEVHLESQQAEILAAMLDDPPYEVFVAPKWGDDVWEGIALLSRLPVLDYERHLLPVVERVAQRITVEADGQAIHIANTHLHHAPEDESIRLPQMRALLRWMLGHANGPWLLAGDLNTLPHSATLLRAKQYLNNAYVDCHEVQPVTWPTPLAPDDGRDLTPKTIDYVLYTWFTLRVQSARRIAEVPHPDDPALYPSDHYGLVVEMVPAS